MLDATIEEQIGRKIRIGDRWLTDWASCNYLGFDLDQEIIDSVPEAIAKWGTHPSWSRLLGQPAPLPRDRGAADRAPGLGGRPAAADDHPHPHVGDPGARRRRRRSFLDGRAHKTIYDGAMVAAGHGANVRAVPPRRPGPPRAPAARRRSRRRPRLIAIDGVNSMTGNAPDIAAFSRVAQEYDALLYVDDAHGFGVIGERSPDEPCDYGIGATASSATKTWAMRTRCWSPAFEGVLVAARLPRAAHAAEGRPEGARAPVPVLGSLTGGVARDRPVGAEVNRTRGDADPRRPWRKTAPPAPGAPRPGHQDAERPPATRSSRCRSRTTRRSTRWAGTCSSTGNTPRWPPTRSCRRTRWGSGSRSPRRTPTKRSTS